MERQGHIIPAFFVPKGLMITDCSFVCEARRIKTIFQEEAGNQHLRVRRIVSGENRLLPLESLVVIFLDKKL